MPTMRYGCSGGKINWERSRIGATHIGLVDLAQFRHRRKDLDNTMKDFQRRGQRQSWEVEPVCLSCVSVSCWGRVLFFLTTVNQVISLEERGQLGRAP